MYPWERVVPVNLGWDAFKTKRWNWQGNTKADCCSGVLHEWPSLFFGSLLRLIVQEVLSIASKTCQVSVLCNDSALEPLLGDWICTVIKPLHLLKFTITLLSPLDLLVRRLLLPVHVEFLHRVVGMCVTLAISVEAFEFIAGSCKVKFLSSWRGRNLINVVVVGVSGRILSLQSRWCCRWRCWRCPHAGGWVGVCFRASCKRSKRSSKIKSCW